MTDHKCTGDVETCGICGERRDVIEYYRDRSGGTSTRDRYDDDRARGAAEDAFYGRDY